MSNALEAKAIPEDVMQAARLLWADNISDRFLAAEVRAGLHDGTSAHKLAIAAMVYERRRVAKMVLNVAEKLVEQKASEVRTLVSSILVDISQSLFEEY